MRAAHLASHRFGYSQPQLQTLANDPRSWVLAQFERPAEFDTEGLINSAKAWQISRDVVQAALNPSTPPSNNQPQDALGPMTPARQLLRQTNLHGLGKRWQHMTQTTTPVAERWVQFWANHFCVAATKGSTLALVWPHEYEAIRPHAFGSYKSLLRAAIVHPAMLLYLDNAQSIGPQSITGRRRDRGLNENLARELLELHTLGVKAGYTQDDVTQTAKLLTGWTVGPNTAGETRFIENLHQPGKKTILGNTYPEGPQALDLLLNDLAKHPACADFMASKLCRHFVTDNPPASLVQSVAAKFRSTDGDLKSVAVALFSHDLAWQEGLPPKFKRPEECLISAHRLMQKKVTNVENSAYWVQTMGQALARAPSPQGWPDLSADWLSPDAVIKRIQWAERYGELYGKDIDARDLMQQAFGPNLSTSTAQTIARAESGAQALAFALASPEHLRR
jgi:uncharacterized protein (DUF1800 family)